MQFDRNKLRAAILRACYQVPADRLGAVKLHKILYFLDMIQYARSGNAVTGSEYRKRPFGPTCVQLLPVLREMERDWDIDVREVDYFGLRKKEYVPTASEPDGILNREEAELLDEVVDFVCNRNSARTISEFSHQLPWEMAEFGAIIPYESALLLFPSEASVEAVDRVGQGLDEIEAARSSANTLAFTDIATFRGRVRSRIGQH